MYQIKKGFRPLIVIDDNRHSVKVNSQLHLVDIGKHFQCIHGIDFNRLFVLMIGGKRQSKLHFLTLSGFIGVFLPLFTVSVYHEPDKKSTPF